MKKRRTIASILFTALIVSTILGGCGKKTDLLKKYPAADLSGYPTFDAQAEYVFVDMTMAEIAAEMDAGETFAVLAAYSSCPWCRHVINPLNDVAKSRGYTVAYLNTRKDPSWMSNLDIADYDLFVERFGDALSLDEDGKKHLYTPHIFFVKNGKLVADHPGTVPSHESSDAELTQEQYDEFCDALKAGFSKL